MLKEIYYIQYYMPYEEDTIIDGLFFETEQQARDYAKLNGYDLSHGTYYYIETLENGDYKENDTK